LRCGLRTGEPAPTLLQKKWDGIPEEEGAPILGFWAAKRPSSSPWIFPSDRPSAICQFDILCSKYLFERSSLCTHKESLPCPRAKWTGVDWVFNGVAAYGSVDRWAALGQRVWKSVVANETNTLGRLAVLLATVASGCDLGGDQPPVAHLHGRVSVNSQPLPGDAMARIFFTPVVSPEGNSAPPAMAEVVDSQYSNPSVPVGQVNVRFDIKRKTGRKIPRGTSEPLEELEDLVPVKHRDGMMISVEEGEANRDFEL
jgi:hypothetical protein